MLIPAVSLLKNSAKYRDWLWFVFGASLFLHTTSQYFSVGLYSWYGASVHTQSIDVDLLDLLVVAFYFSQEPNTAKNKLALRLPMVLYFCSILVGLFTAPLAIPVTFYIWQILKMYFVVKMVARAVQTETSYIALSKGLAIGIGIEFLYVIFQRVALGDIQPNGTFGHQNALGFVCNIVLFFLATCSFAAKGHRYQVPGTVLALIIAALTGSRAVGGLAALGLVLAFLFSIALKATKRKAVVGVVGGVFLLLASIYAISNLSERFKETSGTIVFNDGEDDERKAFERAASWMLDDYPFGVGSNNFVTVANVDGYYARANVSPFGASRSGHVHNLYWLTAAEAGYFGILSLVILFASSIWIGVTSAWRLRQTIYGDRIAAATVALFVTYLHSFYEWIAITAISQYFIATMFGILLGSIAKAKYGAVSRKPVDSSTAAHEPAPLRPRYAARSGTQQNGDFV